MVRPSIRWLSKKQLFPHEIDLVQFLILFADWSRHILRWFVLVFAWPTFSLGLTLSSLAFLALCSDCQRSGISRQGRHALKVVQAFPINWWREHIRYCKFKVLAMISEHMHINVSNSTSWVPCGQNQKHGFLGEENRPWHLGEHQLGLCLELPLS